MCKGRDTADAVLNRREIRHCSRGVITPELVVKQTDVKNTPIKKIHGKWLPPSHRERTGVTTALTGGVVSRAFLAGSILCEKKAEIAPRKGNKNRHRHLHPPSAVFRCWNDSLRCGALKFPF